MENLNIHEKEEEIYIDYAKANDLMVDKICQDGLLFKGKISYNEETGCWAREVGNEEAEWQNSKIRLMMIAKDQNVGTSEPWDIREETGRTNGLGKDNIICKNRFQKNCLRWQCGILKTTKDSLVSYDEINDPNGNKLYDNYREFCENSPVVRINVKKTPGGGSLSPSELKKSLKDNCRIICEQIKLYNPNIIICFGGSHVLANFVVENIEDFGDITLEGYGCYYAHQRKKILIDSYHPSARRKDKTLYTDIVTQLQECYKIKGDVE